LSINSTVKLRGGSTGSSDLIVSGVVGCPQDNKHKAIDEIKKNLFMAAN
jgi:hypothetical protein